MRHKVWPRKRISISERRYPSSMVEDGPFIWDRRCLLRIGEEGPIMRIAQRHWRLITPEPRSGCLYRLVPFRDKATFPRQSRWLLCSWTSAVSNSGAKNLGTCRHILAQSHWPLDSHGVIVHRLTLFLQTVSKTVYSSLDLFAIVFALRLCCDGRGALV